MTTPLDQAVPSGVSPLSLPPYTTPATSVFPPVTTPVPATPTTTTAVVPASVQLAARRAFLRTLTQGYAGAIPAGGVTAATILTLMAHPDWRLVAANVGAWIAAPIIAATVSWLSIFSQGVPQDYTNVVSVASSGE